MLPQLLRDEQRDRIVVESDQLELGELGYAWEAGRYVRSFPPGSVTEGIFGRLEACFDSLLAQTARVAFTPWPAALEESARRLSGLDWWLTGSAALAVRGLPVSPRDLDFVVSDTDAGKAAAAMGDVAIEPHVPVENWFCRWWGRAWLGMRVEWVGGVTAAADRPEPTDFGPIAGDALATVTWRGLEIRVPPLELQRAVSARRGLGDRVEMIDATGA